MCVYAFDSRLVGIYFLLNNGTIVSTLSPPLGTTRHPLKTSPSAPRRDQFALTKYTHASLVTCNVKRKRLRQAYIIMTGEYSVTIYSVALMAAAAAAATGNTPPPVQ